MDYATLSIIVMANVAVVGGGLVGSMLSCVLASNGFSVTLFEMREDIRLMEHVPGRSINLALSERGRSALRLLDLEHEVISNHGIPMYGRLIHDLNGQRRPMPYGKTGQAIYSVGRRYLNEVLLNKLSKEYSDKVGIRFHRKLISVDLETPSLNFTDLKTQETITHSADAIIGADGAYSRIRQSLMNRNRFDFHQTYIDHGYIELNIPATTDDKFAMEVNYLHIWPRGSFMMIALPNQDKSFTVTLFMPFEKFESLKNEQELLDFFNAYFPDSIPLIGKRRLIKDFFGSRASPLVSIKCSPYNFKDKVLLIGDAAHAMVPFYGQGMNCGFEDCLLFQELLDSHKNGIHKVMTGFSALRADDAHAICDLAMYNYIEMRDLVNSPWFLARKQLDAALNWLLPKRWIPLYTMVTFTRTSYRAAIEQKASQDRIIKRVFASAVAIGFSILSAVLFRKGFSHLGPF